jgi:hypothetical protein
MSFTVNDPQIKEAYFTNVADLKAVIEYQDLNQHNKTSFTPVKALKSFKNVGDYFFGEAKLEGLNAYTPYRARIIFVAPQNDGSFKNVGEASKWYYTTTTGTDSAEIAQASRILKKFHDVHTTHAVHTSYAQKELPLTEDKAFCFQDNNQNCEVENVASFLAPTNDPILIARQTQVALTVNQ